MALRLTQAVGYQDYLTDSGIGTFEIREAIEVNMVSSDELDEPLPIDFDWEIVSFTEYEVQIQLKYDVPEGVSSSSNDPDNVQITFWAGDLFETVDGSTMRPWITIKAPVIRQVDRDDGIHYIKVGKALGYTSILVLIIGFLISDRM